MNATIRLKNTTIVRKTDSKAWNIKLPEAGSKYNNIMGLDFYSLRSYKYIKFDRGLK